MLAIGSIVDIGWVAIAPGAPRRRQAWHLLSGMLPHGAMLGNRCPRCDGPHGRVTVSGAPYLVSVTYAAGYAIAAVASMTDAAALGIDAEPEVDARRDAAGMRGVLGAGEATVREWTRVEAALKADGRGLRVDPASVVVTAADDGWTAGVPDGAVYDGWDAPGPAGVLLSVALLAPGRA
jgi:4'-phosphopantetheinyl transferase